ncbi:hypothetical protein I7I48_09962 [Histoplasma ohiense]|nr:hypothetical protein I7I48_09962 [Histoplasma ohiense (nom. inval.)]
MLFHTILCCHTSLKLNTAYSYDLGETCEYSCSIHRTSDLFHPYFIKRSCNISTAALPTERLSY